MIVGEVIASVHGGIVVFIKLVVGIVEPIFLEGILAVHLLVLVIFKVD